MPPWWHQQCVTVPAAHEDSVEIMLQTNDVHSWVMGALDGGWCWRTLAASRGLGSLAVTGERGFSGGEGRSLTAGIADA